MTRTSRTLVVAISLASCAALAADASPVVVDVEGRDIAVHAAPEAWLAVPAVASARLVRDSAQLPPECAQIDAVLTGTDGTITRCQNPANANLRVCRSLRDLVSLVRFDPGTIGRTGLLQRWAVEPMVPTGGPTVERIREVVAEAVEAPLERVHYRDGVASTGAPAQPEVRIATGGTSWASKLQGIVNLAVDGGGAPSVTYDAGARMFVTRDHVIACSLASGEARVVWHQAASATVPVGTPGPFTADEAWNVYQDLAGGEPIAELDPIRRAVAVGARIGVALERHRVASAGLLDPKVTFLLDTFFQGDVLALEPGLDRAEVERRAVGPAPAVFDLEVPWSSVTAAL